MKLNPYFITGLTEAEGSFSVSVSKDRRAKYGFNISLKFRISMLVNEILLIKNVKSFFGGGSISIGNNEAVSLAISDIDSINNYVIPHFTNYPLRGTKHLDFLSFMEVVNIINTKRHLTKEGINEIIEINTNMNSYRIFTEEYSPDHVINDNMNYIPIDGHYINGFIAGDGCLALNLKDRGFGRMSLQVSQHKNNKLLLLDIANYFKSPTKIYYHDLSSIQLTLSGTKLWETIIFKHFSVYPLHGTKLIKLNKLFIIRELTLNNKHLLRKGKSRIWNSETKTNIIRIWTS